MPPKLEAVQAEVMKAEAALHEMDAAMLAFQSTLMRNDRCGQENERLRMVCALEIYCDAMMAAQYVASS